MKKRRRPISDIKSGMCTSMFPFDIDISKQKLWSAGSIKSKRKRGDQESYCTSHSTLDGGTLVHLVEIAPY